MKYIQIDNTNRVTGIYARKQKSIETIEYNGEVEIGWYYNPDTKSVSEPTQEQLLENGNVDPFEYRNEKIEELIKDIENKFESITEYGIIFNENRFQCRENDLSRMDKELSHQEKGGLPTPYWRSRENINVEISSVALKQLAVNAGNFWKMCWSARTALIDNLKTLTLKQLLEYNVNQKWNATITFLLGGDFSSVSDEIVFEEQQSVSG